MKRIKILLYRVTFVALPLFAICVLLDYPSLSRGSASMTRSGSSQNHSVGIATYHRHDFLKDAPFKFDKRFKNPCWFESDVLRCLPYFLILGFRKCGTTHIYSVIEEHPETVHCGNKETQFFGYRQLRREPGSDDVNTFVNMFDKASALIHRQFNMAFEEGEPGSISRNIMGDGSVCTLYLNYDWRQFPGNEGLLEPKVVALDYVHHFLPDAKIILIFRDPVERVYSEYYFVYGKLHNTTDPSPEKFHVIAKNFVDWFSQCFKTGTVRRCVYGNSAWTESPMLHFQLGIYYIYWLELLRLYRRNQILVLRAEELDDVTTFRTIFSFLQMSELPDAKLEKMAQLKRRNSRLEEYVKKGPMLESTRTMLKNFYRPFNEYMANLMNDPYFLFI